jgi:exopolysaccharide production protein ExoZ
MQHATGRIQGIQILRGLAASMVVLVHSQYATDYQISPNLFTWDRMLEMGVDLFFVTSGFIMMLVSDPVTGRETRPVTFLVRRIQRIVPLYWFYTLLLSFGALLVPSILRWTTLTPGLVLKSLFFVPAFHPVDGQLHPMLSQGWTLQYEMFFYLCFTIMIGLTLSARVAGMALLFIALLILANAVGQETALMAFFGNTIVFEFVAGMGLYWVYRRGWVVGRAAIPIAIILPVLVWLVGSGTAAPLADGLDQLALRCIVWGVPSLLAVYVVLALPEMANPVARALTRLGDASYSLYLCHTFIVAIVVRAWRAMGHDSSPAFGLLVVLPCCIVASLLSYRLVERPLIALSRRASDILAPKPAGAGQQPVP